MASNNYIYVMQDLSKSYPGGREIVKNVTLAFLPGAKIGVLGVNGAGKSTVLKIMAGLDTEYTGEAWAAEGTSVGYLSQEPDLNPDKDVFGNVLEGMQETHALLQRFEEVSNKFAEPLEDDEMNALIEEQAELQEQIDAVGSWNGLSKSRWMRCGVRRAMQMSRSFQAANDGVLHSVDCCSKNRTCCCSMSRQTISMQNPFPGSNVFWMIIQERLLLLRMIVIFWIMLQAGFLSWTTDALCPLKETIHPGWNRKQPDWRRKNAKRERVKKH